LHGGGGYAHRAGGGVMRFSSEKIKKAIITAISPNEPPDFCAILFYGNSLTLTVNGATI